MKKTLIIISLIIVAAAGGLFLFKGQSHYDPSKYSLSIQPEAKPFGVGSTLSYTLPDQFGSSHSLAPDTRRVIFAFSKATGHIVKSLLEEKPKGYLAEKKAVFIADISGMPTVILNTFALPDMQKSGYPILLIYDKAMAKRLKEGQPADKVIVMELKNGRVTKIEHATDTASLEQLLK